MSKEQIQENSSNDINKDVETKEKDESVFIKRAKRERTSFEISDTWHRITSPTKRVMISGILEISSAYIMLITNSFNNEHYIQTSDIELSYFEESQLCYKYAALAINNHHDLKQLYDDYIYELSIQKQISIEDIYSSEHYKDLMHFYNRFSVFERFNIGIMEMSILKSYIIEQSISKGLIKDPELEKFIQSMYDRYNGNSKIDKFLKEYNPLKIKQYLDQYIIGQAEAKKTLSLAFYEHIYRIKYPEKQYRKDNLLLVGPSGSGKTELLRVLKQISPVNITFFDASGMSSDGWKGNKKALSMLETAISSAIANASEELPPDVLLDIVQKSIIFVDEIDKMLRPTFSNGQNVSLQIQGEVLKIFEDGDFKANRESLGIAEPRFHEKNDPLNTQISTKNILFICAGAFSDIEEYNERNPIGFGDVQHQDQPKHFTQESLIKYGMTPELAGRIPIIETLHGLTVEDLVNIMAKLPDSAISEFENSLEEKFDYKIQFAETSYYHIAKAVIDSTGARGIRSVLSNLKKEIIFNVSPGSTVEIIDSVHYAVISS